MERREKSLNIKQEPSSTKTTKSSKNKTATASTATTTSTTSVVGGVPLKRSRRSYIFRCAECPAEFATNRLRRRHVKIVHKIKTTPPTKKKKNKPATANLSTTPKQEKPSTVTSSSYYSESLFMSSSNNYTQCDMGKNASMNDEKSLLLNSNVGGDNIGSGDGSGSSKMAAVASGSGGLYNDRISWNKLKKQMKKSSSAVGGNAAVNIDTNISSEGVGLEVVLKKKSLNRRTYNCGKCSAVFHSIKTYDAHLSIHPAACGQCGRLFLHFTNLSIHLKRHFGIRNYACPCGKRFVVRHKLVEHMRTHTGAAPLACIDCPQKFRTYSNLIYHRKRHHLKIKPEIKDYVCHCGEVFHTKAKFAWHKEIHDKKPKSCAYCRERFIHKNSLARHIRLSHTDKYKFCKGESVECPICNKLYLKSSMKLHVNTHNIKTEFKCNICNKVFSTNWNLKQHRWIHACRSTKPFKCKTCTAAFIREVDYITHMNIHRSIKPFTCNYCGCQFSRKYNWLRHTKEHEIPKKHQCAICNKLFHRAYYLKEHLRVHSGERPFSCNICGKTSATKTNHNKHIKIHHARDPLTAEG